MNNVPENDWISAYLDGEVTDSQRAELEARLAADPAAQQLLDELRVLRAAVQSLPPAVLDEDLSGRVLELAERQMLLDEPQPALPDLRPQPGSLVRSLAGRFLQRRALVWTAIILLVACVLHWLEPQPAVKPFRNVAMAPPVVNAPAASEHPEFRALSPSSGPPVTAPAPPPVTGPAIVSRSSPKPPSTLKFPGSKADIAKEESPAASQPSPSAVAVSPIPPMPAKFGAAPSGQKSKPAEAVFDDRVAASGTALKNAPDGSRASQRRAMEFDAGHGGQNGAASAASAPPRASLGVVALRHGGPEQAEPGREVMLVTVSITPEAARQNAFRSLLNQQQVVWRRGDEIAKHMPTPGAAVADQEAPADHPRHAAKAAQKAKAQPAEWGAKEATGVGSAPARWAYVVEATPQQIQSVLVQLRSRSDAFPSLTIQRAPGAPRQEFERYAALGETGTSGKEPAPPGPPQKPRPFDRSQEAVNTSPSAGPPLGFRGQGNFTARQSPAQGEILRQALPPLGTPQQSQTAAQPSQAGAEVARNDRVRFLLQVVSAERADSSGEKAAAPAAASPAPAEGEQNSGIRRAAGPRFHELPPKQ